MKRAIDPLAGHTNEFVVLSRALPALARELKSALAAEGRFDLVASINDLRVQPECCGEFGCGSLYTDRWPRGEAFPAGHTSLLLPNLRFVIDVVEDQIAFLEIRGDPALNSELKRLFPSWPWGGRPRGLRKSSARR